MKLISILLLLIFYTNLQTQTWVQVSTPFDYAPVNSLFKINDDVYVSRMSLETNKSVNFIFNKYVWSRAENDTLYNVFGDIFEVGQSENRIMLSCRNGLYFSDNSGISWIEVANPLQSGPQVKDIDISENGIFVISVNTGQPLVKYNETNNDWVKIVDMYQDTTLPLFIQDIASNNTHLFGLQQNIVNPIKSNDTLEGGLYISKDKGETWKKTLVDSSLVSILTSDAIILVCTKYGNLLKSTDNGTTWTVNNIGTTVFSFNIEGDRILANSTPLGIIESRDNGNSWQILNKVIARSQIFKKNDKYLFIGLGSLVYESDSLFSAIKKTNLILPNSKIFNIYNQGDTLLATGAFKRGVQYSTNLGESWDTYFLALEEEQAQIYQFRSRDNQVYCLPSFALYSSIDYGKTFDYNLVGAYNDLLILEDRILVYSTNRRQISRDYGKTFTPFDTTVIKENFKIGKIFQTEKEGLLAFSTLNGVFKSTDNADSWTKLVDTLPIDTTFVSIFDFYEFDDKFYAINATPPRVLVSTDKGKSWKNIEINFLNEIGYFELQMIDEKSILLSSYGGDSNGLWLTTDRGENWINVDSGLPLLSEEILTYNIVGMYNDNIFVDIAYQSQSLGEGALYRTTFGDLGIKTNIKEEIERNYLYTYPPYPNPAKTEVKVLFYWDINIPMTTDDIKIYDITGKKIDAFDKISLVKQANHYGNLIWDCSSAQPGIYLINIKHGTEEKAVKVVVE
jgi:photosystem II stability/assembly factor-like uncharacterized protein